MKIDILVLNYNGKTLLEAYLPSVCEASKRSSNECRVHVVDNLSIDKSVELLHSDFPDVNVIVARENRVLCSYNDAVRDLAGDVVIFLNNDMKADQDFVDHLAKHFENDDVMFAAPRIMNFDDTYNGGRSYLEFRSGAVRMTVDTAHFMEEGATQAISTGAFRRKAFLELGGFDDLYLPGIWEDVDICFRGLLLGKKGVYEPESLIWHAESTTFHREYGKKGKMRLAHRNMFLFFWKNIRDPRMLTAHIVLLIPRALVLFLRGKREVIEGLVLAFGKIPLVMKKRRQLREEISERVLKERDIIR